MGDETTETTQEEKKPEQKKPDPMTHWDVEYVYGQISRILAEGVEMIGAHDALRNAQYVLADVAMRKRLGS